MSRSKRKTPIFPRTGEQSEKDDKRRAHRKERARVRDELTHLDSDGVVEPHGDHPRHGQWNFGKDGKVYDPEADGKKKAK